MELSTKLDLGPERALASLEWAHLAYRRGGAWLPRASDTALAGLDTARRCGAAELIPQLADLVSAIDVRQRGVAVPPGYPRIVTEAPTVLLMADIAGSTRHVQRLGDTRYVGVARALLDELHGIIARHRGAVAEGMSLGDGLMATFATAPDALSAAYECMDMSGGSPMLLHIGLHAGTVVFERRTLGGLAPTVVARICDVAQTGEMLMSRVVRHLLETEGPWRVTDAGPFLLQGLDRPVMLYAPGRL